MAEALPYREHLGHYPGDASGFVKANANDNALVQLLRSKLGFVLGTFCPLAFAATIPARCASFSATAWASLCHRCHKRDQRVPHGLLDGVLCLGVEDHAIDHR